MIGETVSHYRIVSKLGGGGMGVVYEAEDLNLGRRVALKFLPEALESPEALERFKREARAASALNHPHICVVHDLGEHGGKPFIAMERMLGKTLKHTILAQPMPVERVCELGSQMADALEAAHAAGVIHRDLKPANVFVTEHGEAKLLDFGLAKLSGSERQAFGSAVATAAHEKDLTSPGTTLGTVAYMSPEQARGTEVDARSDLFSLGVVLYEMVTGQLPFPGRTSAEIFNGILSLAPTSPSSISTGVPERLDEIILKALEKDRSLRYQHASDLRADLKRLLRDTSSGRVSGPAPTSRARRLSGRSGWPVWAVVGVALAALALGGVWLARRSGGNRAADGDSGPQRIAVLPFENEGPAEDDYFADGVTDEVRGKLTSLASLEVIARGSSTPYKKTTKTPGQIARELDVRYLLTGTIRWQKGAGTSRVHVSPELVEVSGSAAPVSKWQEPFDAELTGIFQVQSDIATHVAQALGVALGAKEVTRLREKPTQNLAAYDAFLRGEAASDSLSAGDPPSLRRAITNYEQAVALDPGFAPAWARLGRTITALYFNSVPTSTLAERARQATERAVELAPDRPDGHLALADYQRSVVQNNERALEHYIEAERRAPASAEILSTKAVIEESLGQWEEAVGHLRQAGRLDPRSVLTQRRLGVVLLRLRRYREASEAIDRGLTLSPTSLTLIEHKAMGFLAQGDLRGARAMLQDVSKDVQPTALVAFLAYYNDLDWVLDDRQRDLLLRLKPDAFDNDQGMWAMILTQASARQGAKEKAREYAEEARTALAAQLAEAPQDPQRHVFLGLALAYLGHKVEAVREGERGVSLQAKDAFHEPYIQHQLARIYILVGNHEKALDLLEPLLKIPYHLSPGWLRVDPNFDPLRGHPRFEKLVRGE